MSLPPTGDGTQVQVLLLYGISSLPLPSRIVLVDINTAGPCFLNCVRAQKGKYHGAYSESRRRGGWHMSAFQGFSRGTRRFHLSVQNTTSVSALKISILFHCSTLDQKVNGRSLGRFRGAPPTPQASSRLVVTASIPNNSPRSNITC
jgi:hypothetical protein